MYFSSSLTVFIIANMDDSHGLIVNETAPLLSSKNRNPKPHPLPWLQISIVLFLQICEPITSQSIYPYINQVGRFKCHTWSQSHLVQLISELDITGGDERKVGYYAGLIVSIT
jgi:hypothetical protein